ncbi:MAG TPA: sugar phosphate isomerase/epimerase family protein [Gammaproteobacteria bacterium]|nr:sugar phosphate isomerase/epimerase family protein [Gammaproteobacteria bacterium]
MLNRRELMGGAASGAVAWTLGGCGPAAEMQPLFSISLAQWSVYRRIFAGDLDPLDFPAFARENFGIDAVEYVNQFFMDKARDTAFLTQLRQRCEDHGVRSLLIMCDREGALGDSDAQARTQAVENHYKWVEAAAFLGCHSIRVNAQSQGSYDEQRGYAADGLRRLSEFGAMHGLNVIVENHGGLSSNGAWLAAVITDVGLENCGTLPDFGNFFITPEQEYDRYLGVEQLMPFARGVSAKSYEFDAQGNAQRTDFARMMRIVLDAGYRGYVGVEWEGETPGDIEGIRLTQALLERVREELSATYRA